MKIRSTLVVAFSALVLTGMIGAQVAPVKKVQYPNLDLVYRTAKAIEAATSVGVTYVRFGEMLQNLATEISIAEDRITATREKEIFERYKLVLFAYGRSSKAWKEHIKSSSEDNSATLKIWGVASDALLAANAYYLNDTKLIARLEAEARAEEAAAKAEAKARAAREAQILASWTPEVEKYVQGLAPELRESVKKECLELGPHAEVWYRQGDPNYHYSVRTCRGIPEKEKMSYVMAAHQIELHEAIKIATRCLLCEWPIKK